MNHDRIDGRLHRRFGKQRLRDVPGRRRQHHGLCDRTDLADQIAIDVVRQCIGQLPDREWLDARLFPQPRGHVSADVTNLMLEDVAMSRVDDHSGIRMRREARRQRGRLVCFTGLEIRVRRIIPAEFEAEVDGRPNEIAKAWIKCVVAGSRCGISAGFQGRAGLGYGLGAVVRESRRAPWSQGLFDPMAMFGDGVSLHDQHQPVLRRDSGDGVSPRCHDEGGSRVGPGGEAAEFLSDFLGMGGNRAGLALTAERGQHHAQLLTLAPVGSIGGLLQQNNPLEESLKGMSVLGPAEHGHAEGRQD